MLEPLDHKFQNLAQGISHPHSVLVNDFETVSRRESPFWGRGLLALRGHDSQLGGPIVKKGVIALLVILALVVLISPGIVGRMAESSVEEQLEWAARENQEVIVTTERFDRGWFSSEGVHRVELGQTGPGATIREALGLNTGDAGPALVINTSLDHGLIPVTSVTREEGSLMPGLGRAVSTMTVETQDGESFEIPGVVYSNVGLGGGISSHYFLDSGSYEDFRWGAADLRVDANPSSGRIEIDGGMDSFTFTNPADGSSMEMGVIEIKADTTMTEYGFSTGDMAFSLASMTVTESFQTVSMGPINVEGKTELDGDRVNSDVSMDMAMAGMPLGDIRWNLEMALEGFDAESLGNVVEALEAAQGNPDPMMAFASMERDLIGMVAAGLTFRIDRLDVSLPQGTLLSKFEVTVGESDPNNFVWTSVLLDMEASADLTIPATLYEMVTAMNPDANMAVAMGILRHDGDNYVMEARYKQGLLTVNGAPMPIPLPGM